MTPSQRQVYSATAASAMLIDHLRKEGALAVSGQLAAVKAVALYDEFGAGGMWPTNWRDYAHVDLLDLADS